MRIDNNNYYIMSSSAFVDPHTKTGGERADFGARKTEGVHEIASQCLVVSGTRCHVVLCYAMLCYDR